MITFCLIFMMIGIVIGFFNSDDVPEAIVMFIMFCCVVYALLKLYGIIHGITISFK